MYVWDIIWLHMMWKKNYMQNFPVYSRLLCKYQYIVSETHVQIFTQNHKFCELKSVNSKWIHLFQHIWQTPKRKTTHTSLIFPVLNVGDMTVLSSFHCSPSALFSMWFVNFSPLVKFWNFAWRDVMKGLLSIWTNWTSIGFWKSSNEAHLNWGC